MTWTRLPQSIRQSPAFYNISYVIYMLKKMKTKKNLEKLRRTSTLKSRKI